MAPTRSAVTPPRHAAVHRPGYGPGAVVTAVAVATLLPLLPAAADPPVPPDPIPLRRVIVPPSRVPAELKRARLGTLTRMPRNEFEALVSRAARAASQANVPPRLTRAAYTARLEGNALVGGGDWTVVNTGKAQAVLALPDFNLAVRRVTTDSPAAPAVLGDLDGKGLGLLVPRAGKQSVFFDWSLRGGTVSGDLTFDLQVPACPVASLELTLPADHTATTARGTALLSGPHDAGDPRLRLWRLQFAGRSRVDLTVRRPEGDGRAGPLVLAQLEATQQLTPQHVAARYDFQLEVLHQGGRELTFDHDPALQPYDVTVSRAELQGWEPGPGSALTVRLREAHQGSGQPLRVSVLCLAPLLKSRNSRAWGSPGMRLRGAAQRENLILQIHPDVRMDDFRPGTFRLTRTGSAADGSQILTLADGGRPTGPIRPVAQVRTQGIDFHVSQRTLWHVGPRGSTLTAELACEVTRGTLFKLPLRITPEWTVEEIRVQPEALQGTWGTVPVKGAQLVVADLAKPLPARSKATLTVRLRSARTRTTPPTGLALGFPDVEPVGASLREGVLGLDVDPMYQATVLQTSHPNAAAEDEAAWGGAPPAYAYTYRGKPVAGRLRIVPRRPRFQVRSTTDVLVAAGRANLSARLDLEPVVGSLEAVIVYLSAPAGVAPAGHPAPAGAWKWAAEGEPGLIRNVERAPVLEAGPFLLALGAGDGLRAALALGARPPGECWRVLFARPLAGRTTVTLQAPLTQPWNFAGAQPLPEQRWEVPVPVALGADRSEGEVILHLLGAELIRTRGEAVQQTASEGSARRKGQAARPESWRTYRHGSALFPGQLPALTVVTRTRKDVGPVPLEVCDACTLTTAVEPQGRLLHHLRFRVWSWGDKRGLPVYLPAGAQILEARADGQWLSRVELQDGPEGVRAELPVPVGPEPHHFEVVYATASGWAWWSPWAALHAPAPRLPVPPAAFRRTWRLPPGVRPLGASVQRLPDPFGPGNRQPWWDGAQQAWQVGQAWLGAIGPAFDPDGWADVQRQQLAEAEFALRRQHPRGAPWTLAEAAGRLATVHLKQRGALVIDGTALREAGVGPATSFSPGPPTVDSTPSFFDRLGLAYLPCRPAAILTTRRQLEAWRAASGAPVLGSDTLEQAVRDAVTYGRDPSGRFQSAGYWTSRREEPSTPSQDGTAATDGALDPFDAAWTEWEATTSGAGGELRVVRASGVRALGVALAGLFCLLAWRGRAVLSGRWQFRLLALWLAAALLGLFWLPSALRPIVWWPALAGCGVALVWYLRAAFRPPVAEKAQRTGSTHKLHGPASAVGALVLAWAAAPGAQTPAQPGAQGPFPVLILGTADDPPERQQVLVSPELIKKLEDLARPPQPVRAAVLLGAAYHAKVTGDRAEVTAEFEVCCPDEAATIALPLAGVELKDGTLWAGARAVPVALPQGGYAVPVRLTGATAVNTLHVVFSARVQSAGDGRELRFTVPRLARSRLVLTLPPGSAASPAVTAFGAQVVRAAGDEVRLEADLGRESSLLARWRVQPRSPRPLALEVRETYLWDLRPPFGAVTAVFRYTVTGGPASLFAVSLPEGTEVRTVDVGQVGPAPDGVAPARLKEWHVQGKGAKRQLRLELLRPAGGEVQVTLGLVPRIGAVPGTHRLQLPVALGARPLEGALAYTVGGLESSARAPDLAVKEVNPEAFLRSWQRLGMREAARPTRAYSFRRKAGAAWLELVLQAPRVQADQTVVWRVQPLHADFRAEVKATSGKDGLMLLDWEAQAPIVVARVAGLGGTRVRHWSRSDTRLQVWLEEPAARAEIRIDGWAAHPSAAQDGAKVFALPCLRLLSAALSVNRVRVSSSPDLVLEPDRQAPFQGLQRLPVQDVGLTYEATQPTYRAAFRLRPSPVRPQARTLAVGEVRDGTFVFTGHVEFRVAYGELRTAAVRLCNWEGGEVQLEAAGAMQVREQRGPHGERSWTLTLPPGVTRRFAARVTGTMPLRAGARPVLPELTAPGADGEDRWVALVGPGAKAEGPRGLTAVKNVAGELAAWRATAERVRREGTAWRVTGADWSLPITTRSAVVPPPVQVLHVERQAAVTDLRRWLHQATYWLYAGKGAELQVALPKGARVLAAALDGTALAPRRPEPDRLALALPAAEGPRVLRLRWVFDEGAETLADPNLAVPHLQDLPDAPVVWTVDVPAGYHLVRRPDLAGQPRAAGPAASALGKAQARYRLSALLAERLRAEPSDAVRDQFADAQRLFYRHCRDSEGLTAAPGQPKGGPAGQSAEEWLRSLRDQNRRLTGAGVERVRATAEKNPAPDGEPVPPLFVLPERGVPVRWYADGPARPPRPQLTAVRTEQWREAVSWSELLAIALGGAWVLSYLPRVVRFLRRLLPEQLVLLGWLGTQTLGVSPLGILLMAAGVCARAVLVGVWVRRLLYRPPPAEGSTANPPQPA
ncbi:MAG: hypothetical protein IT429_11910 [Gemmataceae bacterium]|nr:hypothetical protein [Gemmataceae bacterium]